MVNEILVSLGDENLKGLGEVLGSKSCVKILELLAIKDLAVSDIARELKMKINTTDYNVKKLVKVGLIEKSGHWWSVKGKKMPVYQVTNKKIVISPRSSVAKKFLWVLGLTGAAGIWIRSLTRPADSVFMGNEMVMEDAVFKAAPQPMEMMASNVGISQSVVDSVSDVGFWASLASWASNGMTLTGPEWFLIGAWSAIVLFFIYSLVVERRSN